MLRNATITGTASVSSLSAATGSNIGTLTLADGSITDSNGAISFGNELIYNRNTCFWYVTITGTASISSTLSAATGSTIGTLTLADGSITDSNGAISFGDETYYNRNTCFW